METKRRGRERAHDKIEREPIYMYVCGARAAECVTLKDTRAAAGATRHKRCWERGRKKGEGGAGREQSNSSFHGAGHADAGNAVAPP